MLALIRNLFHRRAMRWGMARDPRSRLRDPRFVSFMAQSNRKTLNTDLKDAMLKGRKVFRFALVAGVAVGCAWVVIESAHALSMF